MIEIVAGPHAALIPEIRAFIAVANRASRRHRSKIERCIPAFKTRNTQNANPDTFYGL